MARTVSYLPTRKLIRSSVTNKRLHGQLGYWYRNVRERALESTLALVALGILLSVHVRSSRATVAKIAQGKQAPAARLRGQDAMSGNWCRGFRRLAPFREVDRA